MPVDANGNVADFIMDGMSTIKRLNPARFYEHYINGARRDLGERIRQMFGLLAKGKLDQNEVSKLVRNDTLVEQAYGLLQRFYWIVSPRMGVRANDRDLAFKRNHVAKVLMKGIYLYLPPDTPKPLLKVVKHLERFFPQVHSPVTFRGRSGKLITTKDKVFIAAKYLILLEKTGENWAAVASARLQHFGIPGKLTNEDKYSALGRLQPTRTAGESELRTLQATIGPEVTAELVDRSTNPQSHKAEAHSILVARNPNTIVVSVDRNKVASGNGRPLVYYRHNLMCGGIALERIAQEAA